MRTLVLVTLVLVSGCHVCEDLASNTPTLCAQPDGGVEAVQYVGNGSGTASCTATFDGGLATFSLRGTSCTEGPQTLPVALAVSASCDVSAFPPGRYLATVPVAGGTTSQSFEVPTRPDGGLRPCN